MAWSTLGMEVDAGSGPLAPESCLHALCKLVFSESTPPSQLPLSPLPFQGPSPWDSLPANQEEPAEQPPSVFLAHWPMVILTYVQRDEAAGFLICLASLHHATIPFTPPLLQSPRAQPAALDANRAV